MFKRLIKLGCLAVFFLLTPARIVLADETVTLPTLDSHSLAGFFVSNVFDIRRPFSAVVDVSFKDITSMKITTGVSVQDGNIRAYVDMGKVETGLVSPTEMQKQVAAQQRAGLSRYVVLIRNGDSSRYTLFPDRHTYHSNDVWSVMTVPGVSGKAQTLRKTDAGSETFDGHDCRKVQWSVTDKGESATFLTGWYARDLGDFPVKIEIGDGTTPDAMSLTLKQIKFGKMDAALFEIPAGYKCLESVQAIAAEARAPRPVARNPDTKSAQADRVLKWQEDLVEHGDPYGEYRMGIRYRDGDGVPKDLVKARELLQKAANQNNKDAEFELQKLEKTMPHVLSAEKSTSTRTNDIIIQFAEFGMGKKVADVADRLTVLLDSEPDGFIVNAEKLGADPLPGKKKRLVIHYSYQGKDCTLTVQGGNDLNSERLVKHAQK